MATTGRGDFPFSSTWPTIKGLVKEQRWGNTDQALKQALNNWFFNTPAINNNINLFINGKNSENDNLNLFANGKDNQNQELDLFIHGFVAQAGNLNLFIAGPIQITDNLDLFIRGFATETDSINLTITGHESFNQSLDLFINGFATQTDNITLFISSINLISSGLDLFVHGKISLTNNLDLLIKGNESFNQSLDLFIKGKDTVNQDIDLFINGPEPINNQIDLFIIAPTPISESINLFISGPIPNIVKADITQVVISSGLQNIIIPDFGVVKAVIFIAGNPTATGIQESGIQYSVGFTDGIKSRSIGFSSEDNVPDSKTWCVGSENHLFMLIDKSSGNIFSSAIFDDWIQDGIRINSDVAPSGNYLLTAIFFGGNKLDVLVDTFVTPSTTGNFIDVDTVFEPDQLIGISNGFAINEIVQGLGRLCIGFADNGDSLSQGSITYFSSDGATIGSPASIISSGIFQRRITLSSIVNSVQISGFTSSGFIAETVTSNGSTSVGFLALKYNDNRDHFVGFVDSPTTSGLKEFTNPNFHPLIAFQLLTQLESLDALVSFNKAGAHGLSVFTEDKEFCHSFSERSSSIMINDTLFDDQAINFPNHSGLTSFMAPFDSMTTSGWKLNFTSIDGTTKKWLALAIEDPIIITSSGQIGLFISGQGETNYWNLFLRTPDNDIATSRSLHIYGSPSGVDLNFAGQEIDLFVKSSLGDSIYPPVASGYSSLFMGVESGNESSSGYWSLFLKSDASISNGIDLYISTHEKIASGFIDLFIARIPDFPGEEGFTPINAYQTLFLKTIIGETDTLDLFISGFVVTVNSNIDCFIEGVFTINDNLNLVLFGISGIIDNNLDLFIYGIDNPNSNVEFFIRGY